MTDPQSQSELERLRSLLLAPEQHKIEAIDERLDDPHQIARDISEALPQAVRMSNKSGGALANNLTPVIEKVMEKSVRKNPGMMIDILFPIIGSAVRKAAVEMFDTMVQSINQTLENSFSWRSIRWRFEAWRTSKPFAEIVLFHTVLFRVEQVFVIHKETGLLLHHLSVDENHQGESELVSSMLTAIQDFVRDSFAVDEGTPLESLNVSEFKVWIESGPDAYLAVVLRGSVPMSLRQVMRDVLSEIHQQYSMELTSFEGDATPFADAGLVLAPCMQSERREEKGSKRFFAVFVLVCLGLLSVGGYFWHQSSQLRQRMLAVVANEPGYHLTGLEKRDGIWHYQGLRDPLTRPLQTLIQEAHLDETAVDDMEAYYAMHPDLLHKRAQQILQPPDSVTFQLKDETLILSGSAPQSWLVNLPKHSPIPGIVRIDRTGLTNSNLIQMQSQIKTVEGFAFYFENNQSELGEDRISEIDELAKNILAAITEAKALEAQLAIEIRGFGDQSGSNKRNRSISTARANYIRTELINRNIPENLLKPVGFGVAQDTTQDPSKQRRVVCKVIVTR